MSSARLALDRTLRLLADDVEDVSDEEVLTALLSTKVCIVGDASNCASHSAQCAIITAATLMARTGLEVWLDMPDLTLVGPQPPLVGTRLLTSLLEIGKDLIPGVSIRAGIPPVADLIVVVGNSPTSTGSTPAIHINATDWSAALTDGSLAWQASDWPMGGMAAGSMAAAEATKTAIRKLRDFAKSLDLFDDCYGAAPLGTVELAPAGTRPVVKLGSVELISGGAIINAVVFALCRLPNVSGALAVTEPDTFDLSNLNRCAMLRRSVSQQPKGAVLSDYSTSTLKIAADPRRFEAPERERANTSGRVVLVGVDDIPTRWNVQDCQPSWLGVGATSHWLAMASYHAEGLPCARCLHPHNEAGPDLIPTIAFVSFWSGLWLSSLLLRHLAGEGATPAEQQNVFAALHPTHRHGTWRTPIQRIATCPSPVHHLSNGLPTTERESGDSITQAS